MKKKIPLLKRGKNKKHDSIVNDFEKQKQKHLEKLATKMIDLDQKTNQLKEKKISGKFLDNF
jgi:putative aminopeptidase FrvX